MIENENLEKKSIRFLKESKIDWDPLAKDCVCFANGQGGSILLGIENNSSLPHFVNPANLRKLNFKGRTTLKNIEDYRLEELICKDLDKYPSSSVSEIQERNGKEISIRKIQATTYKLLNNGILLKEGNLRWTRYSINKAMQNIP